MAAATAHLAERPTVAAGAHGKCMTGFEVAVRLDLEMAGGWISTSQAAAQLDLEEPGGWALRRRATGD